MQSNQKKLLMLASAISLFSAAMPVAAQQIGTDAAKEIALKHFRENTTNMSQTPSRMQLELAYTSKTEAGNAFYVFNNGEAGFVIVGADAVTRPILGYSDNGSFDYENIPDNLRWWLSQYESQFYIAKRNNAAPFDETALAKRAPRPSVNKMLTTTWNQSEPYWNAIPKPGGNQFVTGCVATAMAQVMNFYKCPTRGSSSHSYNINYTGLGTVTFEADFSNTTYDWSNMLNDYSGSYSDVQANAVATLMYHVGVSVDMKYNGDASGTDAVHIPYAVSEYFGYDKSTHQVRRDYYSDSDWEDMIYGELSQGRPVLYSGQDYRTNAGHEFVCDGYDSNQDMYHFNWGWGGYCDGIYSITGANGSGVLQPNGSGIGGAGSDAAYTAGQTAILGMEPDAGGAYIYQIVSLKPYTVSYNSNTITNLEVGDSDVSLTLECSPFNISAIQTGFQFGAIFRNMINDWTSEVVGIYDGICLPVSSYYSAQTTFSTSSIIYNGEYEIIPMFRESSTAEWKPMLYPKSTTVVPTLTVSGRASATPVDVTFAISNTTVPVRQALTISHDELYSGTITYTSSNTSVATVSDSGIITGVSEGNVRITASAEATAYYNATVKDFDITITPFELLDIEFAIDNTEIEKGYTAQITHSSDYTGSITYTSSKTSVATVDDNGLVTAIASGVADITVSGTAAGDYKATNKTFTITVPDEYPDGVQLSNFKIANQGYVTPTTVKYSFDVKNRKAETNSFTIVNKIEGATLNGKYSNNISIPENYTIHIDNDLSGWASYFNNNVNDYPTYTLTFKSTDESAIHKIDGVSSITLTMCPPLTVNYTMTSIGWGTICLPFEAEIPTGLQAFSVASANGSSLNLDEVNSLEMGKPYILKGTAGNYSFSGPDVPYNSPFIQDGFLVGAVGTDCDLMTGDYIMQVHSGSVGFYKVPGSMNGTPATQYRAFLRISSQSSLYEENESFILCEDVTGIEEITNNLYNHEEIFDINGLHMNQKQNGFNIVRKADGTIYKIFIQK